MPSATGIAIGRASATIAQVSKRGGSLTLDRYGHFSLDEMKAEGIDIERPDRVVSALLTRLGERRVRPGEIALGVSGRDAIIRYTHLPPMPDWRLKLVMQYEIQEVSEKSGAPLSADYRVLGTGKEGSVVLVAMAKDERVSEWVDAFAKAGVEVISASPLPVALSNSYRFLGDKADEGTTLVLDVGRSSTDVSIIEEGKLSFARSVAAGGDLLTEKIARELDLEKDEAEKKKLAGEGKEHLGEGLRQLSSLVKASLEFAKQQLKLDGLYVHRVAVAGGASRTEGLPAALGSAANAPAALFDPIAAIDASRLPELDRADAEAHPHEAAAAIGLALGRVLPNAIELDLLPNSVKAARTFRHRTLWMRVAAGVLAASVLVGLAGAVWARSGHTDRAAKLRAARNEVDGRLDALKKLEDENAARAKAIAALAGRARPGYHFASLLAAIAREMPPRASVVDVSLERSRETGTFRLEVRGQADNAQRDALETMRKLEAAIGHDPDVSSAKIQPTSGVDGQTVEWLLVVVPNAPATAEPEPGKGS
jgi:type IV pilus assembly protein PilM